MNHKELLAKLANIPLILPIDPPGGSFPHAPASARELINAKGKAAEIEMEHGMVMNKPSPEEKEAARSAFGDNMSVSSIPTTPGVILHMKMLLDSYDHIVVNNAQQIRNYVTNRLIMESTDKNANIRLRALENLGKISGVDLFSEKIEVMQAKTISGSLEEQIRRRLEKIIDAEVIESH